MPYSQIAVAKAPVPIKKLGFERKKFHLKCLKEQMGTLNKKANPADDRLKNRIKSTSGFFNDVNQ